MQSYDNASFSFEDLGEFCLNMDSKVDCFARIYRIHDAELELK